MRYAYRDVAGTVDNLRFVRADYQLQSDERDGVGDTLPRLETLGVPPQPAGDALLLAQMANGRLDRGVEAGYDAINQVGDDIETRKRLRRQLTVEDVEQQIADVVDAVRAMIVAQRTVEPPVPPPVVPIAPMAQAASLEIPPRKPKRPLHPPPKRRK